MTVSRVRHCQVCNVLRCNDCKIGCHAADPENPKSWVSIEAGRDKVREHTESKGAAE